MTDEYRRHYNFMLKCIASGFAVEPEHLEPRKPMTTEATYVGRFAADTFRAGDVIEVNGDIVPLDASVRTRVRLMHGDMVIAQSEPNRRVVSFSGRCRINEGHVEPIGPFKARYLMNRREKRALWKGPGMTFAELRRREGDEHAARLRDLDHRARHPEAYR